MPTRVILLGASNLTRSFPSVVGIARLIAGEAIEVLAAHGHGRSYGRPSRVLARSLPGIVDCGLWAALGRAPEATRTLALATDLGNDIVYGASPATITGWVEACVSRLREMGARTILTRLPLESIERTGPARFRVAKTLLFPRHAITRRQALDRAAALEAGLALLARRHELSLQPLPGSWYGLDPIHIRRTRRRDAWPRILEPWRCASDSEGREPAAATPFSRAEGWRLRRARPERWWLFGRSRTTPQPAVRLDDGTTVSLY